MNPPGGHGNGNYRPPANPGQPQVYGQPQPGQGPLKEGALIAWAKERITDRERVDALMKAALAASLAQCPRPTPGAPPLPYR